MSPESAAQKALICESICAMKEGLRLAQSMPSQPFEQIGFLGKFSRLLEADFEPREKPDSRPRFGSPKTWILRGLGASFQRAMAPRRAVGLVDLVRLAVVVTQPEEPGLACGQCDGVGTHQTTRHVQGVGICAGRQIQRLRMI